VKRLLCLAMLSLSLCAFAQGKDAKAKDAKPVGGVNWEGQILKATGSGAPDLKASTAAQARLGAEMAAKLDALRNLIAQAKSIQVSAGKTLGEEMTNDEVRARVEGAVKGFRIANKRYFSDQGVEIDVEVPLSALASALEGAPSPEKPALKTEGAKVNTGLVIDARGLSVTPALQPRILDEAGKVLYGAAYLSDDARKSKGVASYFQSLDSAKKSPVVGEKPLVIKAAKVNGSDVILSADDIKKLAESNNAYLAEGRVAIVTN
jgi:hypothetical protein